MLDLSRRVRALLLAGVVVLVAGCAGSPMSTRGFERRPSLAVSPSPSASTSPAADPATYAATVVPATVDVHTGPDGPVATSLANPLPSGAPLTLLLVQQQGEWLEVLLPVRPNGSRGWVRAAQVVLEEVPYRLDVRTADHKLDLYEAERLVRTFPIGIGKRDTPTPGGTFYLKELLEVPDPTGFYGPYAYGLSGFSTTLETFAGGEAVIGLHGTNDPSSIGGDASSGCIRMRNADITELARLLPLGTPVRILA